LRSLYDVERTESRRRSDVAAATDHPGIARWVKRPIIHSGQRGVEFREDCGEALEIVWVWLRDKVKILGSAYEAVSAHRDPADDNEADVV